jgi:UDP-N-acetylmuramate--alanine ligase
MCCQHPGLPGHSPENYRLVSAAWVCADKILRNDFAEEISKALRPQDEIWMSEIFYAGGTTTKDISANDLVNDLKDKGAAAYFVENRNDFLTKVRARLTDNCVLLLMGARDPSLEEFAKKIWNEL